MPTKSSALM